MTSYFSFLAHQHFWDNSTILQMPNLHACLFRVLQITSSLNQLRHLLRSLRFKPRKAFDDTFSITHAHLLAHLELSSHVRNFNLDSDDALLQKLNESIRSIRNLPVHRVVTASKAHNISLGMAAEVRNLF